jgi:beta-phosphoglucomutase
VILKKPIALIFDMDGVLVDSEPLHKRAKEMALDEIGIQLPASFYDSYKGRPDRTVFHEGLAGKVPEAEIPRLMERKHQLFEQLQPEVQPVAGAVEFVRWASTRFRLALATSATPRDRAATLQMLKLEDCFESIVDTARFERAKPDPQIFQVAMRDLGVTAADCWIIEDSLAGVRAAKGSGAFTIAITTTFDASSLRDCGADMVIDSFAELRGVLDQSQ